jgi:Type IX secretion system membrane protein PorP/SprF
MMLVETIFLKADNSTFILKKIIYISMVLVVSNSLRAQITTTQTLFQYSMTPFQPTALPYNYLDKFDRKNGRANTERGQRETSKLFTGWYLNAGTRTEFTPQSGAALSGVIALDNISNPDKLGFQYGGGVMYNDLEAVQITTPFFHASVGTALTDNLRLLGGLGYQLAMQRLNPNRLNYKDLDDPKVAIANDWAQRQVNIVSLSAALVEVQQFYIGIGIQRALEDNVYNSFEGKAFTEANLLVEYAMKLNLNRNLFQDWGSRSRRGSTWSENPNRGFLTNLHFSLAMRYLMSASGKYPLLAQLNVRTTLSPLFWAGTGWNTAGRAQLQFGLLKIPVYRMDASTQEYQIWMAYDIPTPTSPRHGVEFNLGYYF